MAPIPGDSGQGGAGHPRPARPDLDRQAQRHRQTQRLEDAKARSQAIIDQIKEGASHWESLYESAYARLAAKLDSMPVIEQAKGVLMAQRRCGPDEASDLLRRAAQRANVEVSVLAAQIVEQVAGPEPGRSAKGPGPWAADIPY